LLESFTNKYNGGVNTSDFGPLFGPLLVSCLIFTTDNDSMKLSDSMKQRHNVFAQCTRDYHKNVFITDVSKEIDALISIIECMDGVDNASQLADCVATVFALNIDVVVQPNHEDILHHFNVGSLTNICTLKYHSTILSS
jgi:hypothetical protein